MGASWGEFKSPIGERNLTCLKLKRRCCLRRVHFFFRFATDLGERDE